MRAKSTNSLRKRAGKVRPAQRDDVAAIAELLAVLGYPSPIAQVERRLTECAASRDTAVFVALSEARVVGVISFHCIPLFHADGSLGRITSLVVAPDCRRHGIGRLLVAKAEEFAWAHGCIRVEVTSGDHREDAHEFYVQLGYQVDCRRFIKHRTDRCKTTRVPG